MVSWEFRSYLGCDVNIVMPQPEKWGHRHVSSLSPLFIKMHWNWSGTFGIWKSSLKFTMNFDVKRWPHTLFPHILDPPLGGKDNTQFKGYHCHLRTNPLGSFQVIFRGTPGIFGPSFVATLPLVISEGECRLYSQVCKNWAYSVLSYLTSWHECVGKKMAQRNECCGNKRNEVRVKTYQIKNMFQFAHC
jgi:hypothetical protein